MLLSHMYIPKTIQKRALICIWVPDLLTCYWLIACATYYLISIITSHEKLRKRSDFSVTPKYRRVACQELSLTSHKLKLHASSSLLSHSHLILVSQSLHALVSQVHRSSIRISYNVTCRKQEKKKKAFSSSLDVIENYKRD